MDLLFQFEDLFDEMIDDVEDVFAEQYLGLITSMADGAIKHNTRQTEFIKVRNLSIVWQ